MSTVKAGENIFDALGFDPDQAENLRIRTQLMLEIESTLKERGLSQTDAAELLDVSQPRVSDLLKGKINKFTIDMLVNWLSKLNKHVEVAVSNAA